MQEKHLFEYAVIRVVPQVEREEFLNTGVILFCASQRFLEVIYELNEVRIKNFSSELDLLKLEKRLKAFEQVCMGGKQGGPIGALPLPSRFRWLTAVRSTVVQTSPVHPGLCANPKETLIRLHQTMVK